MLIWTASASRPTLETLRLRRGALAAAAALAVTIAACSDSAAPRATGEATMSAKADAPGTHRRYSVPVKVGNGRARTYVVLDQQSGAPVEAGVALDETAMEGLPAPMPMPPGQHEHSDVYLLQLPARHGTPFQFVELDWNPAGHGYPYTAPHRAASISTSTGSPAPSATPSSRRTRSGCPKPPTSPRRRRSRLATSRVTCWSARRRARSRSR